MKREDWISKQRAICLSKIRFKSHCAAEKRIYHLYRICGWKLKMYYCWCCRGWHLTKGGNGRGH